MAEWEEKKAELDALGVTIYAVSTDTHEQAEQVAAKGLTFPVVYGMTKEEGDSFGAWWGNHPPDGEHIQPAEFLLGRGGIVLGSMYASGPVGRMSAEEAIRQITGRERRRSEQKKERGSIH